MSAYTPEPEPPEAAAAPAAPHGAWGRFIAWMDNWQGTPGPEADDVTRIRWAQLTPFILLHLACLFVFVVGFSWFALAMFVFGYALRVFGITVGYHRYFSHRSFKTNRLMQFVLACCGAAAVQRGPLWWAAHHRHHHKHSDTDADHHSPVTKSFWWSHTGWFMSVGNFRTRLENIADFAKFPELRFLDRFDVLVPVLYGVAMFGIGELVGRVWPATGTDGWQVLVWGFVLSTVAVYHATFTINSLTHAGIGRRRYATSDDSRNVAWLAPFTFGESWHNNHHHFPGSARLGFRWWELDIGYISLKVLAALGLVHDLRPVPERYLQRTIEAAKRA